MAAGYSAFGPAAFDACERLGGGPEDGEVERTAALDRLARAGGEVRAVPVEAERVNRRADRERGAALLTRG